MAKSLFGNKKNSDNMADKYRAQNEAALRQERADELDGKITELSNARRDTEWAKGVLALYESVILNEDIFDLLVNLALIKVLKKEAETFLAKKKERDAIELKNKAEAEARAAKQKIDDYEDSIVALSKAPRTERWCKDVESLAAEINALSIKERAKIKSTELLEELEDTIVLVRKAADASKTISAHYAKSKQDKAWATAALDIEAGIARNVKPYLKNADELKEMIDKAKDIINAFNKQDKAEKAAQAAAEKAEKERLAEIERQKKAELDSEIQRLRSKIAATKEGKTVLFGSYPQKGSTPEPVEWILLWKNGPTAVLMSKYVLDCHEYDDLTALYADRPKYSTLKSHDSSSYLRWDISSLRSWLNNEFLNTCFSPAEQAIIKESNTVSQYGYNASNSVTTLDKVAVPSYQEMTYKYFKNKKKVMAKATPYALSRGTLVNKKKLAYWWTRDTFMMLQDPTVHYKNSFPLVFMGQKDVYRVNIVGPEGNLLSTLQLDAQELTESARQETVTYTKGNGIRPLIEVVWN